MTDNATPNDIALLPCPFCGGEVFVRLARTEGEADCISHKPINGGYRCGIEEFSNFAFDDDVASLWNTRVALAPGQRDSAAGEEGWRRGMALAADIVEERDGDKATIDQLRTMAEPSTEQARAEGERITKLIDQIEAGDFEELDAAADKWAAAASVQRMANAMASVFERYASQDIMDRFREKLGALMHLAFVEGAAQGVLQLRATSPSSDDAEGRV